MFPLSMPLFAQFLSSERLYLEALRRFDTIHDDPPPVGRVVQCVCAPLIPTRVRSNETRPSGDLVSSRLLVSIIQSQHSHLMPMLEMQQDSRSPRVAFEPFVCPLGVEARLPDAALCMAANCSPLQCHSYCSRAHPRQSRSLQSERHCTAGVSSSSRRRSRSVWRVPV